MSDAKPSPEPSMEEILASIRRILAEDEHGAPSLPPRARGTSDVLDLTEAIGEDGSIRHIEPQPPARDTVPRLVAERAVEPSLRAVAGDRLVSKDASDAVATSFARLAATPRQDARLSEAALDEAVRATLRPMLQAWLDEHLPGMVERLVQAEIARLVGDTGKR